MNVDERKKALLETLKSMGFNNLPDNIDNIIIKFDSWDFATLITDLKGRSNLTVEQFERIMEKYSLNVVRQIPQKADTNNNQVKQIVVIAEQTTNFKQQTETAKVLTPYRGSHKKETAIQNNETGANTQQASSKQAASVKIVQPSNDVLHTGTGKIPLSRNEAGNQDQGMEYAPDKIAGNENKVQPQSAQTTINPWVSKGINIQSDTEQATPNTPLSNQAVMEYTASLWKYVPIPENEPESHAEYDMKSIALLEGGVTGARVRGKKHKHEGTNCDDWFEIENIDEWVLIAVSDGAGSKKYSRIGARESCKSAIAFLKDNLSQIKAESKDIVSNIGLPFNDNRFMDSCSVFANIVQNSVQTAYDAVENAFKSRKDDEAFTRPINRELSLKDFSGTILVALAIPVLINDSKEYFTVTCHIGDGMLVSINEELPYDKALKLLGEADGGSFAGETDFLTSSQMRQIDTLMKRTKIGRRPISCLMVMSDGVADDYYPNDPQLLRLYLDLQLNGIIGNTSDHKVTVNGKNLEIIKKVPKPISYPWVNDSSKQVFIQYADRVMDATNLTLEDLWNSKDIVSVSSLHTFGLPLDTSGKREETLKTWLDNYVERGSFDDRTLVILHI